MKKSERTYKTKMDDLMLITGKTTGTRIRQARNEKTQEELSEMTGLSLSSIKNWERDKSEPSLKNVKLIAKKLNTSPILIAFGNNTEIIDDKKTMLINQMMTLNEEDIKIIERMIEGLIVSSIMDNRK